MASYAEMHPVGRSLLIFNMYAGRLEIVTVFVLATAAGGACPARLTREPSRAWPSTPAGDG
jgi:Trk-type K+ transport system membrane component